MRERTPESSARSGNGASARDKPGVRQQRAPSRWRKSLLAVLAALVTASVQRLSFRSPQTCCAGDAEVVEQPLPAGEAQHSNDALPLPLHHSPLSPGSRILQWI